MTTASKRSSPTAKGGRLPGARTPRPRPLRGPHPLRQADGLELLPFAGFEMNAVWMELMLIAQLLVVLTDTLLLRGELSGLEPKRLRYRALQHRQPPRLPCSPGDVAPGRRWLGPRSSPPPSRGFRRCRRRPAELRRGSVGRACSPHRPSVTSLTLPARKAPRERPDQERHARPRRRSTARERSPTFLHLGVTRGAW
jgi:hypothetical protein